MISYIEGEVIYKKEKSIVIETGGIGYEVFTTLETSESLSEGEEVKFFTYHAVREDSETLFGFKEKEDLKIFELLNTVSGVGPKTALGILNIANANAIKKAVANNNSDHLHKVFGVGKKVAEKIVIELKGKLQLNKKDTQEFLSGELEALEALKSLGYSHKEARDTLQEIPKDITSTNERIKEALKILGKN